MLYLVLILLLDETQPNDYVSLDDRIADAKRRCRKKNCGSAAPEPLEEEIEK